MARRVLSFLVVASLLGGALIFLRDRVSAASRSAARTPVTASAGSEPSSPSTNGAVVDRRACIDPTSSSAASFAPGVVAELAGALLAWAPAPALPSAAVPARPRLELTVETVGTASLSTQTQALQLVVPAVPGLAAPPSVDAPDLASLEPAWQSQETAWSERAKAASTAARLDARTLSGLPLDQAPANMSAIWQCVAALAESAPPSPATGVLVASDLQNNEPGTPFALGGASVLIDQSCPSDAPTTCPTLAASWTAGLKAAGASTVTVVPANVGASTVASWLGGR